MKRLPCSLCGGGGTDTPCPECGETLPPNPLTRALDAAQETLEPVLYHPGVAISNGRAKVYVGGSVIASVPVLGGDKIAAVRQVTRRALEQSRVRCACGLSHRWGDLPSIGEQRMEWGERLELRNCTCGSTLSVTVDPGQWDAHELADIQRDPDGCVAALGIGRRVA